MQWSVVNLWLLAALLLGASVPTLSQEDDFDDVVVSEELVNKPVFTEI